jgi:hypothetical protein
MRASPRLAEQGPQIWAHDGSERLRKNASNVVFVHEDLREQRLVEQPLHMIAGLDVRAMAVLDQIKRMRKVRRNGVELRLRRR